MDTNITEKVPEQSITLPAIGAPFEGGFYAGQITNDGINYALIVSPKADGEKRLEWKKTRTSTAGTQSVCDGFANSEAMNNGDHPAAQFCRGLSIAGFTDWYLPSRDELEVLYRNLKPTDDENYTYDNRLEWYEADPGEYNGVDDKGNGHNASSVPPGDAYTEESPEQTTIPDFIEGGPQAFSYSWYHSSTEFHPDYAWAQDFVDGLQARGGKDCGCFVRAVRKVRI